MTKSHRKRLKRFRKYASRTKKGAIKVPKGYSRHHRKPRSLGGGNEEYNISIVTCTQHDAWHALFGNFTPETIVRIINERWIDPDYKVILAPPKHA